MDESDLIIKNGRLAIGADAGIAIRNPERLPVMTIVAGDLQQQAPCSQFEENGN